MPDVTITVPAGAVASVSKAYDGKTGAALLAAVKADLAGYLKEKVTGVLDKEARDLASKTVTQPDIS